ILACTSLLVDAQIRRRSSMREDLGVQAEIFSANSTAALSFNDPRAGAELLSTLRADGHITSAYLYSANGRLFAGYHRRAELQRTPPPLRRDGSWFESGRLILFKSIQNGGQKIGTVVLESDLGELHAQLEHFLWTILAVVLGASLLAVTVFSRLQ